MRSDIFALAGALLFAGGCASATPTRIWETGSVMEKKDSIAPTLVERTLQSFREVNQQAHHRLRTYEEILRAAGQHGYRMFDWNRAGSGPSVVLIGWEHAPLGLYAGTPSVDDGLRFILDTYNKGDVFLPEGYGSGERVEVAEIYKPWTDMAQFLVENRSRISNDDKKKVATSPVFFIGSDNPDMKYKYGTYQQLLELYELWVGVVEKKREGNEEEGMPLLSAYLDRSIRYFPDLTEEERLNFGAVYERYSRFIECQESDVRELEYLLPTIMGLVQAKNPNQLIYVTRGVGHIHRRKLLERLKDENIGFVALVPEGITADIPRCD